MTIEMTPLVVGEVLSLTIEKLVDRGWGMGRVEGRVVFVPGVCAGELVTARVTALRKGYAEAQVETILQPASDRVHPPCPVVEACGGCQWQHIAYPVQVQSKMEILREDLKRLGGLADPPILPVVAASDPFGYRTRLQLKVDLTGEGPLIGFFGAKSHRIVPVASCLIASPALNEIIARLWEILREPEMRLVSLTEIHLHTALGKGEIQLRYMAGIEPQDRAERLMARMEAVHPAVKSQVFYGGKYDRWVWRRDYLIEKYGDLAYRISDKAFAQINYEQNVTLMETVRTFAGLTGKEKVLELYCGIGNLGLILGREAKSVLGYDVNRFAIADATHNAKTMRLSRCRFTSRPVHLAVNDINSRKETYDVVIVDPPREGIDRETLKGLARLRSPKIVLVSCNPSTLARDLRSLSENGYQVQRIQPIDLFPQTYHLEAVVELTRGG
jgi:23S rRNA (uracil1939-C5)-methyltransferase